MPGARVFDWIYKVCSTEERNFNTHTAPESSRKADFSLHNVTVGDTGNYSCVYFQTRAPFWASEPSDF